MARLRYNGLSTTLGAALASGDTTITFAAALTHSGGTAVPTIAGADYIPLTILTSTGAVSEIVSLTAYTSGATTGTITRAQESTTAVAHSLGDPVVHSATVSDFTSSGSSGGGVLATADATTSASYTQSTTTVADIDATNLAVTFTAPTSGTVEIECSGLVQSSATAAIWEFVLRSGTTSVATLTVGRIDYTRISVRFRVTGLSSGTSYTYKWAWQRLGATTGTLTLFTGGNGGTNGNARMTVRSL